jgi:hypothetical protein
MGYQKTIKAAQIRLKFQVASYLGEIINSNVTPVFMAHTL